MQIKLLKSTVVGGKAHPAGAVVDAQPRDAKFLINIGKAEPYTAPKKAPPKKTAPANKQVETDEIETR